jgi:SRSO17 transposase
LKEELGLDHYEGRQWLGWHHHVCLVTMAYAFLRAEQARLKKKVLARPGACPKYANTCWRCSSGLAAVVPGA